jgi:hypothetical protein
MRKYILPAILVVFICIGFARAQEAAYRDRFDTPTLLGTYNDTTKRIKSNVAGQVEIAIGPMATKITEGTGVTYIATAPIGTLQNATAWQVKNITVSGANTTITWAGGGAFNQTATNLTALTYN